MKKSGTNRNSTVAPIFNFYEKYFLLEVRLAVAKLAPTEMVVSASCRTTAINGYLLKCFITPKISFSQE
jgi:hypothetical protein